MTEVIILIKLAIALLTISPVLAIVTYLTHDEKGKRWWE